MERFRHLGECHVGKPRWHAELAAQLGNNPAAPSLAKTSRETLRQAIAAKALHDKVDEYAGLGREQCSGGVVDRDRSGIRVPLWHQSYECALFEMRQGVRHGDERHAETQEAARHIVSGSSSTTVSFSVAGISAPAALRMVRSRIHPVRVERMTMLSKRASPEGSAGRFLAFR